MTLAVVQSTVGVSTGASAPSAIFGSAPTNGNLLIAIGFTFATNPTANTGWTMLMGFGQTSLPGANGYQTIFYKYAGSSESTTQAPDSASTVSGWACSLWEISGVTGIISEDFAEAYSTKIATYPSTSGTVPSFSNVITNELILMGAAGNQGAASTYTNSDSPTLDGHSGAGTAGGGTQASYGWHYSESTSGNTITPTITCSNPGSIVTGVLGLSSDLPEVNYPKVVQAAVGTIAVSGTLSAVFNKAPTTGNLLLAIANLLESGGAPSADTGWTADTSTNNGTFYAATYYKYAGASESTTQTVDSTTRTNANVVIYEISGVGGTWSNDHVATHIFASTDSSATTYSPSSFNTSKNNELVVAACMGGTSATPICYQTSDRGVPNVAMSAFGSGAQQASAGWHYLEATSGATIDPTYTSPSDAWFQGALVELINGASGGTETGNVSMALAGVNFATSGSKEAFGSGTLTIKAVDFDGTAGTAGVAATATITLGGITVLVNTIDLNTLNPVRQFSTFG